MSHLIYLCLRERLSRAYPVSLVEKLGLFRGQAPLIEAREGPLSQGGVRFVLILAVAVGHLWMPWHITCLTDVVFLFLLVGSNFEIEVAAILRSLRSRSHVQLDFMRLLHIHGGALGHT